MDSIINAPSYGQVAPTALAKKKWNPNIYIPLIVIPLALVWWFGVGSKGSYQAADIAVAQFHGRFNQNAFEQIYDDATPAFQRHGTREETLRFFETVRARFGNEHQTKVKRFFVNRTLNGTYVIMIYSTTFDRGSAEERFTWRTHGTEAKLVGYRINPDEVQQ
jgi:hypothetical protein